MKLCWICGEEVKESAPISNPEPFYLEIILVKVNKPYSRNHKAKPVYVCNECGRTKIGVSEQGENLNP